MISCHEVRKQFSELLDLELASDLQDATHEHLAGCESCRAEYSHWKQLDQRLEKLLVLENVEQNIAQIQRLKQSNSTRSVPSPTATSPAHATSVWKKKAALIFLGSVVASICFLVAQFGRDKNQDQAQQLPKNRTIVAAKLVHATGPVELQREVDKSWLTVNVSDKPELEPGARLRTSATSLCEIETSSQGKVRMHYGCEVVVESPEKLTLVQGKIWCSAPKEKDIEVCLPIKQEIAMFRCPTTQSLECQMTDTFASCSTPPSPSVANATQVELGREKWSVKPGQTLMIDQEYQISQKRFSTGDAWQLPLLAAADSSTGELRRVMVRLLAPIGKSKVKHLNEQQILALGPPGAIPLLVFVLQEKRPANKELRHTAISLAATTADQSAIPLLKQLVTDADEYIAKTARDTLKKLTA